jgi:hypothetical protein
MSSQTVKLSEGTTVQVSGVSETVGEQLDEGAEGEIYSLKGDSSSVIKIFYESDRATKANKVKAMIQETPDDPADDFHSIVWPQAIVENSGDFLGYSMPRLDLSEWTKALVYAMKISPNSSLKERLRPAYNLAYMVYKIQDQGHALGDFNHENIFVKDGNISLIDCDGFHIKANGIVYEGDTFKKRYSPPEKRPPELEEVKVADRFCLGVHIFQLLMDGYHPYHAKGSNAEGGDWGVKIAQNSFPYTDSAAGFEPPEPGLQQKYDNLPQEIQDLFQDCFSESSTRFGWARPSAVEWVRKLGRTAALDVPESELPSDSNGTKGGKGDDDELSERASGIFGNAGGNATGGDDTTGSTTPGDDEKGDLKEQAQSVFRDTRSTGTDSGETTGSATTTDEETDELKKRAQGVFGDSDKNSGDTGDTTGKTSNADDDSDDGKKELKERAKGIFGDADESGTDSEQQ